MIKDLYEYALAHPDVVMPDGYAEAGLDYIVCVTPDGHVKDVLNVHDNGKFIRPVRNGARNDDPFVRKAEVFKDVVIDSSLPEDEIKKLEKTQLEREAKRHSLIREFGSCCDQALSGIRTLLSQNFQELMDRVALDCSEFLKGNVGFSVLDGAGIEVYVWNIPGVKSWWSGQYAEENRSCRTCVDILTGEPCYASKLIKNTSVKAAGGGQTSGSNLISFNAPSFNSYGFEQGANMPAGMGSLSMAIDAYNYLAVRGVRLADMRLLCWCSGLDSEDERMLNDVFRFDFDIPDRSATQEDVDAAGQRIKGILSAPVDAKAYGSLERGTYHVMLTKADAARISVLYYATGDCADLLEHYRKWHVAMDVPNINGRNAMKQRNAYSLIYAATSLRDRNASDVFSKYRRFVKPLIQACMQGRPLSNELLARAVRAFQSAFYPKGDDKLDISKFGSTVQLINLCLNIGKEESDMPDGGNCAPRSVAYLCGRLFSVHEWFYGVATNDSGVMTERFVACCQKPVSQIKKIQMLCAHRMRNVNWCTGKKVFRSECEEIFGMLDEIPASLCIKQQAEFILGYWYEKARITEMTKSSAVTSNDYNDKEDEDND